jgi:hypothetical protein
MGNAPIYLSLYHRQVPLSSCTWDPGGRGTADPRRVDDCTTQTDRRAVRPFPTGSCRNETVRQDCARENGHLCERRKGVLQRASYNRKEIHRRVQARSAAPCISSPSSPGPPQSEHTPPFLSSQVDQNPGFRPPCLSTSRTPSGCPSPLRWAKGRTRGHKGGSWAWEYRIRISE